MRPDTQIQSEHTVRYVEHTVLTEKIKFKEALESGMCDVIKISLKRRIATKSGKGNQSRNIKTAVDRPIRVRASPQRLVIGEK